MKFEDLHKVITPQQLKLLASFVISKNPPEEIEDISLELLTYLIMQENPDYSDEELVLEVNKLYVECVIKTLDDQGLIQSYVNEDGEFLYGLTDKGKDHYDVLQEDK